MTVLSRGTEILDFRTIDVTDEERMVMLVSQNLAYTAFRRDSAEARANNLKALKSHGLLDLTVPALHGGKNFGGLAFAAVIVELAKGDPLAAWVLAQHCSVLTLIEHLGGTEMQNQAYSAVMREGSVFCAAAHEEGWNPFTGVLPATSLKMVDGGYKLSGRKVDCALPEMCNMLFVNATMEGDVMGVMVPRDATGVSVLARDAAGSFMDGAVCDVVFDDVFVPSGVVTHEPLNLLFELEYELGQCAVFIGIAETAYRVARELAKPYVQAITGERGGNDHPDAGRLFLETGALRLQSEPAWLTVLRASKTGAVGNFERGLALAQAKHVVGEFGVWATDQAMRIAGRAAFDGTQPLQQLAQDARWVLGSGIKPSDAAYIAGRFELEVAQAGIIMDRSQMRMP